MKKKDIHKKSVNAAKTPPLKDQANCRCKGMSKKSYPELFKIMVKDLTFWKKVK